MHSIFTSERLTNNMLRLKMNISIPKELDHLNQSQRNFRKLHIFWDLIFKEQPKEIALIKEIPS